MTHSTVTAEFGPLLQFIERFLKKSNLFHSSVRNGERGWARGLRIHIRCADLVAHVALLSKSARHLGCNADRVYLLGSWFCYSIGLAL